MKFKEFQYKVQKQLYKTTYSALFKVHISVSNPFPSTQNKLEALTVFALQI